MKNPYRDMMEEVTLSHAARASIEDKITNTAHEKRRFTRPLRAAVIVVCLCLVLPVTAIAIGRQIKSVELGKQIQSDEGNSYNVVARVEPFSEEHLSEDLRADLNSGTLQQIFESKQELESYLGLTLIQSTELENAPIVGDLEEAFEYGFDLRPQLALDTSARYILTASDWDGNAVTENPDVLKVSCHRVMENSEIYLDAWIIMDSVTMDELEEGILGENFRPVTGWNMVFETDENGNYILDPKGHPITHLEEFTSSEYDFTESTYAMPNGNTATIITSKLIEPDGSTGLREYMGYFVEDGILYTVRPYAIYNPNLDYPMEDSDMLRVLKVVLDSYE